MVKNERELAVQFGARLFEVKKNSAAARKLVKSSIEHSERPFAEAQCGFLEDASSRQVNEVRLGRFCESFSCSGCGKYVVAAIDNHFVVMEADTLSEKLPFKSRASLVKSVCFLPQSSKIIFGSMDGTVHVWDLNKPDADELALEGQRHGGWVTSVRGSPDGSRVSSGSDDKTVRLWRLQEESSEAEGTNRSKWIS